MAGRHSLHLPALPLRLRLAAAILCLELAVAAVFLAIVLRHSPGVARVELAAAAMLPAALAALALGHLLTRRLAHLAAVADAVSAGATGVRAGIAGRDEVARVGRAFDGVVGRLEAHLAAARLDRDRLALPAEAMHEGFALWDAGDRLVRCNARLRELLGPAGREVAEGTDFPTFAGIEAGLVAAAAGEGREAWLARRLESHCAGADAQELGLADGRWLRVSESRLPEGGAIGIYADVTEAKARELALDAGERRLRAIVDAVQDGIVTLDRGWRAETVNPAAAAVFGLDSGAAAVGMPLDALVEPEEGGPAGLVGRGPVELAGRRADGTRFPVEVSVSALEGDAGPAGAGGPAFVAVVRDATRQKADRELILFHANHDPLTGLPNRRLLEDRLATALRHARRRGELVAVALLDVDRFKAINDSLGHAAGDELLVALARRFAARLRESDTVARLGGDEFIFVLTGLKEPRDALWPAAKLLEAVREPVRVQDRDLPVSASLGVSLFPTDGSTRDELLKHADAALYRAKAQGRDRCELHEPAAVAAGATGSPAAAPPASLEADLRGACAGDQLVLFYQPRFDLASGRLVGLEALPRWRHPRRGLLGPEAFLPLADRCGLGWSLAVWTLRRALHDLAGWPATVGGGSGDLRVSVRLSGHQLAHAALPGQVQRLLAGAGLRPGRLELALDEAAPPEKDAARARATARLHALGVGLSLDGAKVGRTSLAELRRHPVGRVRLDRALVRDLARGGGDAALARHLVELARELGLRVVAEGIETAEQLAASRELGCHEGQGRLLGGPVLAGEVPALPPRAAAAAAA